MLTTLLLACTASQPLPPEPATPAAPEAPAPEVPTVEPPSWPDEGAPLAPPTLDIPPDFGVRAVFIDPGHGAANNPGNTSALCESEQDFTLAVAEHLSDALVATGAFAVTLAREGDARVGYWDRVHAAESLNAEVFLSLHSDVRGQGTLWSPTPDQSCHRNDDNPGFTILWSDEVTEAQLGLDTRRHALAAALAARMLQAGFPAYDGEDYESLYAVDPERPGVFVDRHQPSQRILVLRRPAMPSVIIETHHAWDPREVARWREPATLDAFAASVAAALVDALR